MPGAMSFVEIDRQHAELLPARTGLSLFSAGGGGRGGDGGAAVCIRSNEQRPGINV